MPMAPDVPACIIEHVETPYYDSEDNDDDVTVTIRRVRG